MDTSIAKCVWTLLGFCLTLHALFAAAQQGRSSFPTRRRPLPTVIITREHLLQRQAAPFYGSYGDTAAEFVVSAGLDTSKSTAVRIRKLGHNDTARRRTPPLDTRSNASSVNEVIRNRPQLFNEPTLRKRPQQPQTISRRQDVLNERNSVAFRNTYFTPGLNGPLQRYVPPIFVPRYQQNDHHNIRRPDQFGGGYGYPVQYKPDHPLPGVSSGGHQPVHPPRAVQATTSPVLVVKEEATATKPDDAYRGPQKEGIQKTASVPKGIVAETPVLKLNVPKADSAPNLIRRPSLVLRDQITVNELPEPSARARYGPRAIEHSRRRRQAEGKENFRNNSSRADEDADYDSDDSGGIRENFATRNSIGYRKPQSSKSFLGYHWNPQRKSASTSLNVLQNVTSLKNEWDDLRDPEARKALQASLDEETENEESIPVGRRKPQRTGRNHPMKKLYDSHRMQDSPKNASEPTDADDDSGTSDYGEVMSFSDFLASPIAEKIRLERQFAFRNASTASYETFLRNATLLRNIIAARLLHGLLNATTNSSNRRETPDKISSAEQRQFGIVVSPYDGLESIGSKSTLPIIRVLRGKIVPIPDLPQELIPIVLGTYKPTQTSFDDPSYTESILDKAILALLQNEDILGSRPWTNQMRPYGPRFNRKSPSTNYVGSLKASEHKSGQRYFKPAEWSLGPRCDRLTEEICLDDSDYPSSAILSSIHKDKARFDLMYAEVKVRESQVEGLSRQQEQAYTASHLYAQASHPSMTREQLGTGGFVCPSEVHYARPHRAKNRKGEWKVVVNVAEYTQTMRMEKCIGSGNPCKYVMAHIQSTCAQVYSYHRLLVFSKDMGLHIDLFRVPTGCTCHLRGDQTEAKYSVPLAHRPFEEYGGHVETAPPSKFVAENSGGKQKKNSFSGTLWAILGGGPQAGALAQQPQFLDEVQKQISWTHHLNPHVLKQISPNQVLKQLLEEEEDDYSIRRQRIRPQQVGYSTRGAPLAVPLPPPPPPPVVISRRPVVSDAQDHLFGALPAVAGAKVFSLTRDGRPSVRRPSDDDDPQRREVVTAYKIYPSGVQVAEVPVHENAGPGLRPAPPEKHVVEDEDLLAVEKSEGARIHAFRVETVTEPEEKDQTEEPFENDDSKINFSYHPILEYLNF